MKGEYIFNSRIIKELSIESDVGETKKKGIIYFMLVLKNAKKIEEFIYEQIKKGFSKNLTFPNFYSFSIPT